MKALNFNQFIYEVESGDKFFSFLGDYVPSDHVRTGYSWRQDTESNHPQRYRNNKDSRFLNVLDFIYQAGSAGRSASEISNLLKSWGVSGGGNILYAKEWSYSTSDIGSRRTGLLPAHCTKNANGRWVLSDKKLKKLFYTKELIASGKSKDEIDKEMSMFELGIDPSNKISDIDEFLRGIDI
jgi:hypothetical protein